MKAIVKPIVKDVIKPLAKVVDKKIIKPLVKSVETKIIKPLGKDIQELKKTEAYKKTVKGAEKAESDTALWGEDFGANSKKTLGSEKFWISEAVACGVGAMIAGPLGCVVGATGGLVASEVGDAAGAGAQVSGGNVAKAEFWGTMAGGLAFGAGAGAAGAESGEAVEGAEEAGEAAAAADSSSSAADSSSSTADSSSSTADSSGGAAEGGPEPAEGAEPAPAEPTEPAEDAEPAAPAAPAEDAEPAEPAAPAEDAEPAEPAAPAEDAEETSEERSWREYLESQANDDDEEGATTESTGTSNLDRAKGFGAGALLTAAGLAAGYYGGKGSIDLVCKIKEEEGKTCTKEDKFYAGLIGGTVAGVGAGVGVSKIGARSNPNTDEVGGDSVGITGEEPPTESQRPAGLSDVSIDLDQRKGPEEVSDPEPKPEPEPESKPERNIVNPTYENVPIEQAPERADVLNKAYESGGPSSDRVDPDSQLTEQEKRKLAEQLTYGDWRWNTSSTSPFGERAGLVNETYENVPIEQAPERADVLNKAYEDVGSNSPYEQQITSPISEQSTTMGSSSSAPTYEEIDDGKTLSYGGSDGPTFYDPSGSAPVKYELPRPPTPTEEGPYQLITNRPDGSEKSSTIGSSRYYEEIDEPSFSGGEVALRPAGSSLYDEGEQINPTYEPFSGEDNPYYTVVDDPNMPLSGNIDPSERPAMPSERPPARPPAVDTWDTWHTSSTSPFGESLSDIKETGIDDPNYDKVDPIFQQSNKQIQQLIQERENARPIRLDSDSQYGDAIRLDEEPEGDDFYKVLTQPAPDSLYSGASNLGEEGELDSLPKSSQYDEPDSLDGSLTYEKIDDDTMGNTRITPEVQKLYSVPDKSGASGGASGDDSAQYVGLDEMEGPPPAGTTLYDPVEKAGEGDALGNLTGEEEVQLNNLKDMYNEDSLRDDEKENLANLYKKKYDLSGKTTDKKTFQERNLSSDEIIQKGLEEDGIDKGCGGRGTDQCNMSDNLEPGSRQIFADRVDEYKTYDNPKEVRERQLASDVPPPRPPDATKPRPEDIGVKQLIDFYNDKSQPTLSLSKLTPPRRVLLGEDEGIPKEDTAPTEETDEGELSRPPTPTEETDEGELSRPPTPTEETDEGELSRPPTPTEETDEGELSRPPTPYRRNR